MNQQPTPSNYDDEIDLWHYFELIKQYFWPLSFFVVACTAISIAVAIMLPPTYQASTSLLINTNKINTVDIKELVEQSNQNISTHLDTQLQILQSNSVMLAVIKDLDLSNNKDFVTFDKNTPKHKIEALTLEELHSSISISLIKNTKVIKITASSKQPELAKQIANAIAKNYIEQSRTESAEFSSKTFTWLDSRSDELKTALKEAELETMRYKQQNKLFAVASAKQKAQKDIEYHIGKLRKLETKAYTLKQTLSVYQNAQKQSIDKMLTMLSDRPAFAKLQSTIEHLETTKKERSKRYGPGHNIMVDLQRNLSLSQSQAKTLLNTAIQNTKNQLALNKKLAQEHQSDLNKARDVYEDLEIKTFGLKDLQRQESRNRAMYEIFSKRARETLEASSFAPPQAKVVDIANTPIQPVKPKKKLIVILSFMLSGMLGLGFIILLDSFRQQLSSRANAKSTT